jgi:hypothetical protein
MGAGTLPQVSLGASPERAPSAAGRLPAPSVPALGAPGDARHFNRYTESVDEGDGAGAAGPGPGGAAGEDAFSDFGVTRLITEDAVRCFQRRMSCISNG